jgi:hypothetical protein
MHGVPGGRAPAFPAEFALACACCRWPPSEEKNAAVVAAADGPIDWDRLVRIAARQRIEGLVHEGLTSAGVTPPRSAGATLRETAAAIARRNLAFAAESVRLQRLLAAAAIPSLVLKGSTVAVLAYHTLALKHAWDIDILVAPGAARRASDALVSAGYEHKEGAMTAARFDAYVALARDCAFRHRTSGAVVELHWRLVESPSLLPGLDVASPAQEVTVAPGMALRTLAPDELFAYLCVHGASHGWSRLKWLADTAALLSHETPEGLERLYHRSQSLGAGRCPGQTLLLCARLLATRLPEPLAAELNADAKVRRLVAVALDAMAGGGAEIEILERRFVSDRVRLSHFLLGRGWRYQARELKSKWVSVRDRVGLSLPRPLHFLYDLMRAPLWLWRRMSP